MVQRFMVYIFIVVLISWYAVKGTHWTPVSWHFVGPDVGALSSRRHCIHQWHSHVGTNTSQSEHKMSSGTLAMCVRFCWNFGTPLQRLFNSILVDFAQRIFWNGKICWVSELGIGKRKLESFGRNSIPLEGATSTQTWTEGHSQSAGKALVSLSPRNRHRRLDREVGL